MKRDWTVLVLVSNYIIAASCQAGQSSFSRFDFFFSYVEVSKQQCFILAYHLRVRVLVVAHNTDITLSLFCLICPCLA